MTLENLSLSGQLNQALSYNVLMLYELHFLHRLNCQLSTLLHFLHRLNCQLSTLLNLMILHRQQTTLVYRATGNLPFRLYLTTGGELI